MATAIPLDELVVYRRKAWLLDEWTDLQALRSVHDALERRLDQAMLRELTAWPNTDGRMVDASCFEPEAYRPGSFRRKRVAVRALSFWTLSGHCGDHQSRRPPASNSQMGNRRPRTRERNER